MAESVSILISEEAIKERLGELGAEISRDFAGETVTLICALKGAIIFAADLVRKLECGVELDFIGASSYNDESTSSGKVKLTKELDFDIQGKHILLVEDILDTGHTIAFLRRYLLDKNPASIKICCLLDKPDRRVVPAEADYTGFLIPDQFVVGYGLDYAQRYRNLPYIGVLHISESH